MRVLLIAFFVWLNGGGNEPPPPPCQLPDGWSWLDTHYIWVVDDDGNKVRWIGDVNGHKWLFSLE